jgi:hypothetical protein
LNAAPAVVDLLQESLPESSALIIGNQARALKRGVEARPGRETAEYECSGAF